MNQDFAASPTPSLARKLLHISRNSPLQLSEDIIELSKKDRVTSDNFDVLTLFSTKQLSVIQFMIDCSFRAVIGKNLVTKNMLLNAAKLAGINSIVIGTDEIGEWKTAFSPFHFSNEPIVKSMSKLFDMMADRHFSRDSLLIVDGLSYETASTARIVREFPKSVITVSVTERVRSKYYWDSKDDFTTWIYAVENLFPRSPYALAEKSLPIYFSAMLKDYNIDFE